MKVFNCRSPYIVSVDNGSTQIATKLEILMWRVGYLESTAVTKTVEKTKYSPTQYINYYNISPFVYDYIDTFNNSEFNFAWNVKIIKYSDTGDGLEDIGNEYLVAVNGYNAYDNPNYDYTTSIAILNTNGTTYNATGYDVNYYYDTNTIPEIDLIIDFTSTINEYRIKYSTTAFVVDHYETYNSFVDYDNDGLILQDRQPMVVAPDSGVIVSTVFSIEEIIPDFPRTTIYSCKLIANCEQKYNPFALEYVNRLGGKQTITLFKNSTQSIEVKSSDYNTNTFTYGYPMYDEYLGQKRIFNKNGTKSIKCNTGWMREDENINIQDIFLSEMLYLKSADGTIDAAVTLKSTSQQFKTHLNDKVINYELEFEVASSLINNVV
jgi:hypothetical protein